VDLKNDTVKHKWSYDFAKKLLNAVAVRESKIQPNDYLLGN
jgi:hypothetical protein